MAEQIVHELTVHTEAGCETDAAHYCATSHVCKLCDYIFASSVVPPIVNYSFAVFNRPTENHQLPAVQSFIVSDHYTFPLRGPPAV